MRSRTRLILDGALFVALLAAYKPTWTGITWHEWLCIAVIVPLLVHFIVNWDWVLRTARTFVDRLFHASRLNFVIDSVLLVSTVTVMLSGFMVAPALLAPFGIHPSNLAEWLLVHSWSANVTVGLLLLHTALHGRWLLSVSKKLVDDLGAPPRTVGRRRTIPTAVGEGRSAVHARTATARPGSRIGARRAQAARERAMALRTLLVLGLTFVLGFAISTGVGLAAPFFPETAHAQLSNATATLACPQTGCKASTCHGGSGVSPEVFYGKSGVATPKPAAKPKALSSPSNPIAEVASPKPRTTAKVATSTSGKTASAPTAQKSTQSTSPKSYVCPATGCVRSSCHGTSGQSPRSFYK